MTATATLEKEEQKAAYHLHGRAVVAARRYLELRGYEVQEYEWPCESGLVDMICRDGDALVFVKVQVFEDELPDDDVTMRRKEFECMAISYLMEFEIVDMPIRLDVISILLAAADRALLRHHINALSEE